MGLEFAEEVTDSRVDGNWQSPNRKDPWKIQF